MAGAGLATWPLPSAVRCAHQGPATNVGTAPPIDEVNQIHVEVTMSDEIVKAKIRRALLSGPDCITRDAAVAEMGTDGKMALLRPGTNHWVCIPGNENVVGAADMCADLMGMQWMMDVMARSPAPRIRPPA